MKTAAKTKAARGTPESRKAAALAAVKAIATRDHLNIMTLKTRGLDSADFHDMPVWAMEAAIEAAFEAGYAAAQGEQHR